MADFSLADIAALGGKSSGGLGMAGALGIGALAGLFFGSAINGGGIFGGGHWGNGYGPGYGAGFANAIGYENLATSNEVQRGFDNQNSMANEREILGAVNAGTAQSVAATNQSFHDLLGVVDNRYNEVTRDIGALQVAQAQSLANQNECCCATKLLLTEQSALTNANIAQSRYDAALNTAALQATIVAEGQKTRDVMAQNKIENLQSQVADLRLANQMQNVVRYPNIFAWNAGPSPFCSGCGCNGF